MRVDIKSVHYQLTSANHDFFDTKIKKIDYAKDYIKDLLFTVTKDGYKWVAEVNISFRWGVHAHLKEESFNLHESIEKLIDKLDSKTRKEKEKVQDHRHH